MNIENFIKHFPYKIILGSASPRRQELLKSLGFSFTIKPLNVDEDHWPENLKEEGICLYLAERKAGAYKELKNDELLITSDTIVWCNNKVYNKPKDHEDGVKMLNELKGKKHTVYTAVCLRSAKKTRTFFDQANVYFKDFNQEEIEYYLTNFKPFDKAGAYGVQDWLGYTGIEKIEGSFYNVMGLPVKKLWDELLVF